jgi:hypothetical protein
MHITSITGANQISHDGTLFEPIQGFVFDVPQELGEHLLRFGEWRQPEQDDYGTPEGIFAPGIAPARKAPKPRTGGDMLVIVPHTKTPAIDGRFKGVEKIPLSADDDYWNLLSQLWSERRTFIIVEHDVAPSKAALEDLWDCPEPWCSQPYPYLGGTHHGLGCTKFTAGLMGKEPLLWDDVARMSDWQHPSKHWCRLDAWSQNALNAAGWVRHQHHIPVAHPVAPPAHGCQS